MIKNQRRITVQAILLHGLKHLGKEQVRRVVLSSEFTKLLHDKERSFTFPEKVRGFKQDRSQIHVEKLKSMIVHVGASSEVVLDIVAKVSLCEESGMKKKGVLLVLPKLCSRINSIKQGEDFLPSDCRPKFSDWKAPKSKKCKEEMSVLKPSDC